MTRWILLALAAGWAGTASLTLWRAPTLWLWKTAILAGEFGHLLVALPVLTALAAWVAGGAMRAATVALCVAAAALFVLPALQAARIARDLPAEMDRTFGPARTSGEPFSWRQLIGRDEPPVPVVTREVAPGLAMDFYAAIGREGHPVPCVVMIHGGGWDNGDRGQLPSLNHHLARRGYAVAAVSYRLAPGTRWPGQADDVTAALAYLKSNAQSLGVDPARLVLMGRSAGGQLAMATAYGRPDPSVRGIVSFYGPQDQVFAWEFSREDDLLNAVKLLRQYLGGTPETAPEAYRTASPYLFATKENAVPTLLVHGLRDSLVWHKQSERMHAKLEELGVPNVFVSLPWATHACDFNPRGPSGQLSRYALERFLASVTK